MKRRCAYCGTEYSFTNKDIKEKNQIIDIGDIFAQKKVLVNGKIRYVVCKACLKQEELSRSPKVLRRSIK